MRRCFYSLISATDTQRYTSFVTPCRKECFKSFPVSGIYCTTATDLTCTQALAPGSSSSSA